MVAQSVGLSRPDFIVIGAQRAGSTWLNHTLRSHPKVVLPRTEIPYFEDPAFRADYDPFRSIARKARPDQIWGFKRPNLLGRSECPQRIQSLVPDVKLVVTLREPVARAVSAYYLALRTRSLPMMPLNDGLRRVLQGAGVGANSAESEILSFGMYAASLKRYLAYFERSALMVMLMDDIKRDPTAASNSMFAFLGVHPSDDVPLPQRNQNVYSRLRIRMHRIASLPLYVRDGEGRYQRSRSGLGPRAFAKGVGMIDQAVIAPMVRRSDHPDVLEDDVRMALVDRFSPDVAELEILLDRSLDSWRTSMSRSAP